MPGNRQKSSTHSASVPARNGTSLFVAYRKPTQSRELNAVPLKSLKFDGSDKGDALVSFLGKFEMYADMLGLMGEEKRAHLC